MAVLNSTLRISLKDMASGPAKRIGAALKGLQKAGSGMAVGNQMAVQSRKMGGAARGMSTGVSMPLMLIGGAGFKAAYGLEKMMNKVQAVGRLTDDQRSGIAKYAQELNGLFPFTNKEIAGAALELLRAGFTYKKVIGALKDTLNLAMAGDIGRSEAADIQTNVLTAMRLRMDTQEQTAKSAKRVADVLSYAANSSNTDVQKLGQTFKFVGPIAASAGASIEKVAAMAMIMANNGIKASEAGVAMRSGLIRMVKPTDTMLNALDGINVNLNDFVGGARKVSTNDIFSGLSTLDLDTKSLKKPLEKLLNDPALAKSPAKLVGKMTRLISRSLGDTSVLSKDKIAKTLSETLTTAGTELNLSGLIKAISAKVGTGPEALKIFAKIFDARQVGRLLTLMLGDVDKITADIVKNSGGYAEKAATQMQKGIVGQVAKIKAAWENLFVSVGKSGVLNDIGNALDKISKGLKSLSDTNPQLLKIGTYFAFALAVAGPLGFFLTGIGSTLTVITTGARLASIALLGVGRAGAIGLASLAIGGLKGAWLGLVGVIGRVGKAVAMFKLASSFGGKRVGLAFLALNGAGGLAKMTAALGAMLNPMNLAKAAIRGLGVALRVAFIGTGIGVVIAAIGAAGVWIYNNWNGIKEMFSGIGEGFREALGPSTMAVFDSIGEAIGNVIGWISDLVGPIDASKEQWRSWGKSIGAAIAWPIKQIGKLLGLVSKMGKWIASSRIGQWVAKKMGMNDAKSRPSPAKKAIAAISEPVKPTIKPASVAPTPAKTAAPVTAAPSASVTPAANIAGSIASLSQIEAKANGTVGVVRNAMAQIQSAASLDLTRKGMNIMNTLAAGMRARAGAAVAEMRKVAQQLRDHLPSSPAKTGPLSDIHKLKFGETIAQSIKAAPMVNAMRKAAAQTRAAAGEAGGIKVRPLATMSKAALAASVGAQMAMAGPAGGNSVAAGNSVGDIHVTVHIPAGVSDNATIGEEVGRKVRNAVNESYSDGGI